MKTVRFLTRGESSDFWPEEDANGNPVIDVSKGQLKGEFRVTHFKEGDTKEVPNSMADSLVELGYAEEV